MQLHALWKANGSLQMGHVAYRKTYPVLRLPNNSDTHTKENLLTTMLNVKSDIWEYENELRMTMYDGPEKVAFDSSLIKEVVIGCKMDEEKHQPRLLEIMDGQYPHASVYRAKLRRGEFALDFDKLRGQV
jgi:hypothetical protein